MLFNSIEFVIFLLAVFILYWFVTNKNVKVQNAFLLLASYLFYATWDWRFLFLLFFVSLSNYFIGRQIEQSNHRRLSLIFGLILNIGVLAFFKYFNFFVDGFIHMVSLTGYTLPRSSLKILLPVGISFYIFLSISYLVDIFKTNLKAEKNPVDVLLTLSFFPIILAGPIQRPSMLLPQLRQPRVFDQSLAVDGLRQILWGLVMKVVVADNLSPVVDEFFSNYSIYSGSTLFLGAIYFGVQLYADFSGYSNMAIGIGKLLGFRLMQNFNYPYFSRDIRDFWRRWHISLMNWFRDYVFLPVAYSVSRKIKKDHVGFIKTELLIYIIGILVTWTLTGLWHGANYTFIVWGLIHGFFLILYQALAKPRKRAFIRWGITHENRMVIITESFLTFLIVTFAWIFFKAASISTAFRYIAAVFSSSLFSEPVKIKYIPLILVVLVFEWTQRKQEHALQLNWIKYRVLRWSVYYFLIFVLFYLGGQNQQFIYFQF